jgi:hypothetical protein
MGVLLKQNIKGLLVKKSTWFILLSYLLLGLGNYAFIHSGFPFLNPNFEFTTSFWEYFIMAQGGGSGFLFVVLPLLVTLSTGDFFIKKRHSSILSYSLIRSSASKYIRNEIISTGITSFIFVFFAQTLLLLSALFFSQIGTVDSQQGMIFFASNILYQAPAIYVLLIIINSSLMAFFFSTLSIGLSIILKNKYSAIMLPYVGFIGGSEILMTLPMIFGLKAKNFYDYAPLAMSGDYITLEISAWIIPMYWIVGSILIYTIVLRVFKNALKQGKLLL